MIYSLKKQKKEADRFDRDPTSAIFFFLSPLNLVINIILFIIYKYCLLCKAYSKQVLNL